MPRAAVVLMLSSLSTLSAHAATVSVVDQKTGSLVKVRQGDSVQAATSVTLEAAQVEFEAFQIVLNGPASHIGIQATPLVSGSNVIAATGHCDASGHASAGNIRVYREQFMNISTSASSQSPPPPSDANGRGGLVPDALIPQVDEFVNECRWPTDGLTNAGGNMVFWVEVFVPKAMPAGTYTGKVLLTWTSATSCDTVATINVSLKVWDFQLPATNASLHSHFGASMVPALVDQFGTTGLTELVKKFASMGLDHRISITSYDDENGDLGHYLTEFGPLNAGLSQRTRIPGIVPTRVKFMGDRTSSAAYDAWHSQFVNESWWPSVFSYTVDEPGNHDALGFRYCDIHPLGSTAHANTNLYVLPTLVTRDIDTLTANLTGAPPISGCTTTWGASSIAYSIHPHSAAYPAQDTADVNIMVPIISALEQVGPNGGTVTRPEYSSFVADASAGHAINAAWTYESCVTHGCDSFGARPVPINPADPVANPLWPSIGAIDHSLVRARAMPWIAFNDDMSGILYYDTVGMFGQNQGSDPAVGTGGDPWHNQYVFGGNGDGTLFYPGKPCTTCDPYFGGSTNIPVASLRLKMLREGMEDYEYLHLLAQMSPTEASWAKSQAMMVFPHAWQTESFDTAGASTTAATLFGVRHMLACRILADMNKSDPACNLQSPPTICAAPTPDLCGTTCTNIESDNANCGGCGPAARSIPALRPGPLAAPFPTTAVEISPAEAARLAKAAPTTTA